SPLLFFFSLPNSHAICVGNTMYLSGQLGSHPQTGRIVPGGIVPETRQASSRFFSVPFQALTNLANILDAGQMTLRDVVKVNVYIADMQDYEAMNRIYAEFFTEKFPARGTIRAAEIPGLKRLDGTANGRWLLGKLNLEAEESRASPSGDLPPEVGAKIKDGIATVARTTVAVVSSDGEKTINVVSAKKI
ncbi:unnamed protein product, partial [Ixodes pacificus]